MPLLVDSHIKAHRDFFWRESRDGKLMGAQFLPVVTLNKAIGGGDPVESEPTPTLCFGSYRSSGYTPDDRRKSMGRGDYEKSYYTLQVNTEFFVARTLPYPTLKWCEADVEARPP